MEDYLKTRKVLGYDDVAPFPAGSDTEALVSATTYDDTIVAEYIKKDMLPYTGQTIYVRDAIAKKLAIVNEQLQRHSLRLKVVYGYRHPDVQQAYFTARRKQLAMDLTRTTAAELDRITHSNVAMPDIAGHPAGAAVDVTLVSYNGEDVDMGTLIADYTDQEKIRTYATNVTSSQRVNRQILHDAMITQGFAPFYGEWWHFSHGDREWAAFYHTQALYGAVAVSPTND